MISGKNQFDRILNLIIFTQLFIVNTFVSCQSMEAYLKRNTNLDGLELTLSTKLKPVSLYDCSQICMKDVLCSIFSFNEEKIECGVHDGHAAYQNSTDNWGHYEYTAASLGIEYIHYPMRNWTESLKECRNRGKTLALWKSHRDQVAISNYIRSIPESKSYGSWLGIYYDEDLSWKDGNDNIVNVEDMKWFPGEPSNLADERCGRLSAVGDLKSKKCSLKRPCLCQ